MNNEEFLNELKKIDINITKSQQEKLEKYYNYLIEYNNHTNITAITIKEDVYKKHFYDSLTLTKAIDLNKVSTVIDIGTGAGFPGLVLKIFFPHLKLTLLDSNNKKIKFLENLVKILEINDINIVNERAEEYAINHLNEYDLCVSRAVAFIDIIVSISLPLIKKNGNLILMKGDFTEEKKILTKCQHELEIKEFSIMSINEDNSRNLIIINKEKESTKVLNYSQIIKRNKKLSIKKL